MDQRSPSILFARMRTENQHGIGIVWQFTQWVTGQPRRTLMPEPQYLPARLPFEIDNRIDPTPITSHAGVPLVIELFRHMGAEQVVNDKVLIKQRQLGLMPAQLVETLIALLAAGGDRCQDLQTLRADTALATLLGYGLLIATLIRDFWRRCMLRIPRCLGARLVCAASAGDRLCY
jgi:hypothetical protein